MNARRRLADALASAMLAGPWRRTGMLSRCAQASGDGGQWLRTLVAATLQRFTRPPLDEAPALARFLVGREELTALATAREGDLRVRRWLPFAPKMGEARWPVQPLDTEGDVAQWLGVSDGQLAWLADTKGLERCATAPRLQNYRYRWVPKASGGQRLLEAPKQRLLHLQRKLLHGILDAIPPHDAAHGFRAGRSALTHARLHVGCATVVRFDVRAFFTHLSTARAHGVFRAAGYSEAVAAKLLGLCTNRAPHAVLRQAPFEERSLLAHPHLPQGAPTSPALANLVSWSLDVRLTELGRRFGATYSRYADDLTFSGDRHLATGGSLARAVAQVVRDEGLQLNPGKTRVLREAQRQEVTGVVVNQGPHLARDAVDALKATLHNARLHGLASQARGIENFLAHLQGKVAWVEQVNPAQGAKLRALLARVDPTTA